MRTLTIAAVVLLAVIAVRAQTPAPGRAGSTPALVRLPVALPDNPAAGARLFVEKRCVQCHGLGPEGNHVGPDLGRITFDGTVLDLAGAFWNHGGAMRDKMHELKVPIPILDSREMADLLAFLTAYRYYLVEVGAPASPARGRELFKTKSCDLCHGSPADFRKKGPSLAKYQTDFSASHIAQAMWNHGAEMADVMRAEHVRWPEFTGSEMGDLIAYLQTGNNATGADRVYYEPGSPRRGADLFASKHCRDCHAIGGVGGKVGPDLGQRGREFMGPIAAIAGLMWNHSHRMRAEFQKHGIPRITFSGQEMADVISYLYFVNYATVYAAPSRGERLFADKCAQCHSIGGGRGVGPDLGAVPNLDDPTAIVTMMWNHAAGMEGQLRRLGIIWPQFAPGEVADLSAFLLARRGHVPPPAPVIP
jgi:mono/diheme cytochrome c family protein